MHSLFVKQLALTLTALIITIPALSADYICVSGKDTRTISVEYEHQGWQLPCRVKYEKTDGQQTSYPWRAEATPGYCEQKAEFLASKLESLGWQCRLAKPPLNPAFIEFQPAFGDV